MSALLDADGSAVSSPTQRPLAAILAAVGIPMFMASLDNLVVTNALPELRKGLGASLADLQWFVNAYALSYAALLLTASAVGDRIGRRRVFLAGIGLFTVASAACGLATEPWMLIAARAVQGAGAAAVVPLSLTLLTASVPAHKRNVAIGIWGGIIGLGIAVGPLVGGAVVSGLDWHWIFWLNVPLGVLAVPFVVKVLAESFGAGRRLDPVGLVLSAGGVLSVVWGIIHGADHGWTSSGVLGMLVGGAVLLVGFVGWEWRSPSPMLPLRLFGSRAFSAVNVMGFTFSIGVFGSIFLLSQFLQIAQGYSALMAGVLVMPWSMSPMVVAPLAGMIMDRVGPRTLIVSGQVLQTSALAWLAAIVDADTGYGAFLGPFILEGIGMGLTFGPASTVVMAAVAPADQGIASGTNNTVRQIGVALGIAVLTSVFVSHGSYSSPTGFAAGLAPSLWVGAAVVAVGAVVALLLPGRRRAE